MKVNYTKKELAKILDGLNGSQVVAFLAEEGLEFLPELPGMFKGLWRRRYGMDLLWCDGNGELNAVDWTGQYAGMKIQWTILPAARCEWIRIADGQLKPVRDGQIVEFDKYGRRLK